MSDRTELVDVATLVEPFQKHYESYSREHGLDWKHRPYTTLKDDFNQLGVAELTWDGWLFRRGKWSLALLCYANDLWVHIQSIWHGCDDSTLPAILHRDLRVFGGVRIVRLHDIPKVIADQDVDRDLLSAWIQQVKTAVVINPGDLKAAWRDYDDDGEPIKKTAIYHGPAYVYLMHDPDAHRYKIGVATSPPKRLAGVQAAAGTKNLYIVAASPGTYADEQAAHRAFAHRCLIGEWFEECDEIAEWANNGMVLPRDRQEAIPLLAPYTTPYELIVPEFAERLRREALADVARMAA